MPVHHPNFSDVFLAIAFGLTAVSTIVVGLRLYCRYFLAGKIAAHDYMMVVALLVTWIHVVINYYQIVFGSAVRFNKIGTPESDSAARKAAVTGTLVTWWFYRVLYTVNLFFVKLSILLFYRIIATQTNFRRAVNIVIGFLTLYSLGMAFASIFQCQNPSDAYSLRVFIAAFSRKFLAKCYDPRAVWFAQAAVNLFTDIIILFLPIPCLLGLWMPLNKRLALVGIFSVGVIAIVASCVRVGVLSIWGKSKRNASQFGPTLLLWGQVEVNSGIISASIPFLRPLFVRTFRSSRTEENNNRLRGPAASSPKLVSGPDELDTAEFFAAESTSKAGGTRDVENADMEISPITPRAVVTANTQIWKPFITVPESLSSQASSNRDSAISLNWPLPTAGARREGV